MKSAIVALSAIFGTTEALLPSVTSGNKFYQLQEDYNADPKEFTIYGVDYQPGGSSKFDMSTSTDVLTDPAACQRDAYLLQQSGANAIRIYSVNPWVNHDECMTIFNNAGIYVLSDINTPDSSLHRYDPQESYNAGYLNNVFGSIDAFKGYSNLMGFIAGNEIINDKKSAAEDPPYIRAVVRDVKEYISLWSNRTIPVGYAAADVLEYRTESWQYFECNANNKNATMNEFERIDFFGINSYAWCSGSNDYKSSGYDTIKTTFANSSVPIIFTEYGCNKNSPRTFDEVDQGIYGPLSDVVAGGFVYEYSNEVSNYGLVDSDSDGNASLSKDYGNLQTAFSKATKITASIPQTAVATGTDALKGAPTCNSDNASSGFGWNMTLPDCPATKMMESGGGNRNVGSLIDLTSTISGSYAIIDNSGKTITPKYNYNTYFTINTQYNVPVKKADATSIASSSSQPTSSASSQSSSAKSSSTGKKSKNDAATFYALPTGFAGSATSIFALI